ncbi:YtpI family protein [Shouchella patagoniensis]|uniref:YtpI family protein n=1 Tax=Shouchella patagoniensis TaxID=228576 RepID=UPI0009948FB6|nr:YtpI family protein [Shouchella patagoniensis]
MDRLFIIVAIAAFLLYIVTRIRAFRMQDSLEKRILESRAKTALGTVLVMLSINMLFFSMYTALEIIIGVVFFVFGAANAVHGFKAHKHYTAQLD